MLEPIRILFIGELHSSHALSWIDLLSSSKKEFEVYGLHISSTPPPIVDFPITDAMYLSFFQQHFLVKFNKFYNHIGLKTKKQKIEKIYGYGQYNSYQLTNIKRALQTFKPHIVHTLGVFPASAFFIRLISEKNIGYRPKWIVQARGGPDIALNRKSPILEKEIKSILDRCDYFIADNQQNYTYALDMGLNPEKLSTIGAVPGTGGIDTALFDDVPLPSKKERLILWPKAYNCIQSDGMVVLEALRLALPRIGKFRLIATAATPDVEYWFNEFFGHYGTQVEIHTRLPREQLLEIYRSARVLLAPSLSDGIPNSMYEAMASHTVPILSPIDTISSLFLNNIHTIYAPNLDPKAIAEALVKAMNDDVLADSIAKTNSAWLPTLAGRNKIRHLVTCMYHDVISSHYQCCYTPISQYEN